MSNQIRLKRASGSDPGASDLVLGEPAVRTDTGEIFLKKDDGSIAKVAGGIDDGDKGDITVSNDGGTFTIDAGVITNAKVSSSAAIAGSKISPDFGSQNIVTTGTLGSDDITITGSQPALSFIDNGQNPDYKLYNNNGVLRLYDITNTTDRLVVNSDGHVDVTGNLDVGAGVDVTGNISVSGTVDGRDIASDGSKLDGIASGATNVTNTNQLTNGAGFLTSVGTSNISNDAVTFDKIENIATGGIMGRNNSGTGSMERLTASEVRTLINVENGATADQTASEIVALIADQTIAPSTIDMEDDEEIRLGNSDDLKIFHNGSHSRFLDNGAGKLQFGSDTGFEILTANFATQIALFDTSQILLKENTSVTGNISVSGTVDGRDVASDGSKLDGIESGATADQSASEILTLLKTVDGAGSGLDADSVDGIAGSSFLRSDATDSASGALTFTGGLTTNLTSISNGILELKAAIATSHTLTADYNAIAVDPTINNGVTVTVPSDAVWAIV